MEAVYEAQEREHNRKGRVASIIFGVLIIIIMLIPFLTYPTPPPGQEGILVNLGLPDVGQGDDNAGPSAPAEPEVTPPEPETTPPPPAEATPEPEPQPEKEIVTTEDPDAIRLKQQEEERKRQEAEAEQKRQQELEAERQRQQEAERKKQEAEAERKRQEEAAQKTKDQIGGLFGDGSGKGNTGKPGNQGDPGGDPNSDNLEGVSDGVGSNIGGNLRGRGIVNSPKISKATERGTVVIYLCVGSNGQVTEARVQLRGTSAGASAQSQALTNAKKWRFSPGTLDKQCGTITYTFALK